MSIIRSQNFKSTIFGLFACVGISACTHVEVEEIPVTANPSAEIDKLETARAEAVEEQTDVLSPNHYADAVKALKRAQESRDEGADTKVILEFVALGKANLAKALEIAEVSKATLGSVIDARAKALVAKAPKFLEKEFKEADQTLKNATEEIEDNDLGAAEATQATLTKRYADLELRAIKIDKLAAAAATIEKAENEGAKEIASRTYEEASKALADADAFITANRSDKAGIDRHANAATAAADRLLDVSRQVKVAGKSDAESVVLAREEQKNKLDAEVAAGARTSAKLGTANADSRALETKNTAMAAEQESDDRLDAAKARFSDAEADVYRDGDRLIIRIKTIAFPSGKSTLPPASFGVLGKVQQVIEDLEASHVTVEGHTDSNGTAAINKKLSDERADAIGSYFAANGYAAESISTVGMGDSKPLSSNATKEGRAQNRRVDVIIEPQTMH